MEEHIPLAPYTTFHIGGPGRFFTRVGSLEELKEALAFAKEKSLSPLILGGGSNMLLADEGWSGLVIKIELEGITQKEETLIAEAGTSWDELVSHSIDANLWGLENLSGIPGTVGGAVAGSIGAYGQSLSQTLVWVEALDIASGEVVRMENTACSFGYRESLFSTHPGEYIILRAAFTLSREPKPDLLYKDLAVIFAQKKATLAEIREAVLGIRREKFPDLAREGTAGSFFKNPFLSRAEAERLREKYPELPLFELPEADGVKIPLAWFLDKVLALRGTSIGKARLYEKQPLVIVASRGVSARDVRALAELVAKRVHTEIGIEIEPEVKILGA